MIRTEAQRQFYLTAMGIRPWYVRSSLPGAAASPELDFTEPEPKEPASPPATESRPPASSTSDRRRVSRLRDIRQTMSQEAESSGATSAPEQKESVAGHHDPDTNVAEASVRLEGVTCRLGFWWEDSWCLVSPLSDETSDDLQSGLAKRILASVGGNAPDERQLNWPPFANRSVLRNEGAELQALLRSFSETVCSDRRILMLGLDNAAMPQGDAICDALHPEGASVISGPSLAEMAANPEQKRTLWRRLREVVRESA